MGLFFLKRFITLLVTLIEDSIAHSLKAYPALLAGDMEKATLLIHTTKPPRPKPPRPVED